MDLSYVDGKIWILSAVDSLASAMVKTEKMPRGRKFEKKDGYVEVDTGKFAELQIVVHHDDR